MPASASAAVPPPHQEGAAAAAGTGAGAGAGAGAVATAAPEQRRSTRRIGEILFAAMVTAIGVWALTGAFTIRVPVGNRVGPTAFPMFVGALLVVTGVILVIGALRGKLGVPEDSEDIDPNARTDWFTIGKLVALLFAHLFLIEPIGWTPAATLLFGGVAWVLGAKRWWLGFIVGLVIAITVQIVFGELLGLSLPLGPVFSWLAPLI